MLGCCDSERSFTALNNVTKVKCKGMSPFPTALTPKETDLLPHDREDG